MTASPPLADRMWGYPYLRSDPVPGPSAGSCSELAVGPAEERVLRETGPGTEDRRHPATVNP